MGRGSAPGTTEVEIVPAGVCPVLGATTLDIGVLAPTRDLLATGVPTGAATEARTRIRMILRS